jgi:type IV pilus assembly protein PilA
MLIKMRESKGFTLVELMIVVAIIGILAAVAVPYYQRYVAKSRLTSLVFPGIHAIENAISTKFAVAGSLPASAGVNSTEMNAFAGDADVAYMDSSKLAWTRTSSLLGKLTVDIDVTGNDKFKALNGKSEMRAVATASAGKCYWTYEGTLAREFGF